MEMKKLRFTLALTLLALTVNAQSPLNGDMNHDGEKNITDVMLLIDEILNGTNNKSYLTCPDDNHPHIIDLGLPSGTKWACCNVGANKPESYGGYFAWGETEEKNTYDWSTYTYCEGLEGTCHDLGSSIADTQYDVAHVKWGGSWVMPNSSQFKELVDNCSFTWTNIDGINGGQFTGRNGGQIFMPAASGHWIDNPSDIDNHGYYWSSTQCPSSPDKAYSLNMISNGASVHNESYRVGGLSIRPVISGQSDDMIDDPKGNDPYDIESKGRIYFTGDTMRVLILGNSFSDDATTYLKEVTDGAELDADRFCVYIGYISGGGIAKWLETFENDIKKSYTLRAGNIKMNKSGTLKDILNQPWDVCVILQNSDASYRWSSFENILPTFIETIKSHCPNPQLQLAYMIPWSHTVKSSEKEWNGNIACAKKIADEYGIKVIPVGTAIQNARNYGLDNGMYLTRDNWHLCSGVGKFIANCTMYESLLSSFANKCILNNPVIHTLTPTEANASGAMAVDDSNEKICKQCAFKAVEEPFEITVNHIEE